MDGRCPDTFYCSNGTHGYSAIKTSLLYVPTYAALVTSSLSCLGAALIVFAYCAFKDLRKGSTQTIITLLALADFGSAVVGVFGASLFIGYHYSECYTFDTMCQIQGFMTLYSQSCGWIWTSILAIHLSLLTAFTHFTWVHKLLPLYNIIAWIIPITVTLPLLFLDQYGYTPESQWTCFLRWNGDHEVVTLYLWYIIGLLTTAMTFIGYVIILMYVSCKQGCRFRSGHTTAWRVNKRISVILVAYIILRMPDAIQILSLAFRDVNYIHSCLDEQSQIIEFTKVALEAIADTSQGWVNCVLYIFLSPELRRRMFVLPFRRAISRCKRHKITYHLRTSEIAPLLGNTQNTLSTQERARERGDTYLSHATEFPETSRNPDTGGKALESERVY